MMWYTTTQKSEDNAYILLFCFV